MSEPQHKILPAIFYRSTGGKEPVREWLQRLDREDRRIVGTDIRTVELGWPIGMPVCRPVGNGVFEVRSTITNGRIARVLFCIHGGNMILLHAFVKKTQKTPSTELETALKRKREIEK
jgi:phage-related protein